MVPVVPMVPNVPTVKNPKDNINELVLILRNDWNDWNFWNVWNELVTDQKRCDDLRQLLRLFVRDMVTGSFDWDDLRVGKKFYARAAYRFHEVAFRTVDEKNRTFQTPDESFDLPFRHGCRAAVAEDWVMLPAISAAAETGSEACHVQSGAVGNQRKRFLQRLSR